MKRRDWRVRVFDVRGQASALSTMNHNGRIARTFQRVSVLR